MHRLTLLRNKYCYYDIYKICYRRTAAPHEVMLTKHADSASSHIYTAVTPLFCFLSQLTYYIISWSHSLGLVPNKYEICEENSQRSELSFRTLWEVSAILELILLKILCLSDWVDEWMSSRKKMTTQKNCLSTMMLWWMHALWKLKIYKKIYHL